MTTGLLEGTYLRSRSHAAATGDVMLVACDHVVRAATWKAPIWRTEFASEIVAIAAAAGEVAVLLVEGEVARLDLATGRLIGCSPPIERPRSLVAAAVVPRFAVVHATGATIVEGATCYPIPFERPGAASFDAAGTKLTLAGVGRRIVEIDLSERGRTGGGPSRPLPSECRSLADGFALLEDGLYRATERGWQRLFEGDGGYFLAADRLGKRVAWTSGACVHFARCHRDGLGEQRLLVYPESFADPPDPLAVRGLAFLPKSRLLVALSEGRGNILELAHAAAFKLERHPGDPASAWTLTYGGEILVSEDPPKKKKRPNYFETRIEDAAELESDPRDQPLFEVEPPDEGDVRCMRCRKRTSSTEGLRDGAGRLLCPHCPLEPARELGLDREMHDLLGAVFEANRGKRRAAIDLGTLERVERELGSVVPDLVLAFLIACGRPLEQLVSLRDRREVDRRARFEDVKPPSDALVPFFSDEEGLTLLCFERTKRRTPFELVAWDWKKWASLPGFLPTLPAAVRHFSDMLGLSTPLAVARFRFAPVVANLPLVELGVDRVTHPKFGSGRVLRAFEDKLEIDFGEAGVKTLQARFVTPV